MPRTLPADCAAPVLYVALGDSTVEGDGASAVRFSYPARLCARLKLVYPNTELVNLGLGGAVSSDVVDLELERALDLRPQLVTLSIGPNDVNAMLPVDGFRRDLVAIFSALDEGTDAVVVVNLIPDMSVAPRYAAWEKPAIAERARRFNDEILEAASQFGVEVVDLFAPSRALGAGFVELLSQDGFHPSDLGYAKWADFMWIGVERRIGCMGG